jgi:hypothetical protein
MPSEIAGARLAGLSTSHSASNATWPCQIKLARWYIGVGEDRLEDEIAFLKTEIYLSDVEPRLQTLTALSRFSVRA